MLFNSIEFVIFFPIVTAVYFAIPHRHRWAWLLAASCYFYLAFIPIYILILGFTIVVDYFAGIWIEQSSGPRRKTMLGASLAANLGVLFVFKYYNFFTANAAGVLRTLGWTGNPWMLHILLPIGLSFHTFQAMSYTIEVYRGNQRAERHFGIYALYVMFYPQLVAGPIERPQNLLHQFRETHRWNSSLAWEGFCLMLWGMFKKVVVADRMAVLANYSFDRPESARGWIMLIGIYAFTFQIYCDFSGYSDIARGAARVMGFELMKNFDCPYFSRSISEFWRRWHISLSTWFKDYVFIPLGGSRGTALQTWANLAVVFLLSGLWHGAQWTFVAWGALHAAFLIVGASTRSWRDRFRLHLPPVVQMLVVFHLAAFGWIFFRASSLRTAIKIITDLARPSAWTIASLHGAALPNALELQISAVSLVLLLTIEWTSRSRPWIPVLAGLPRFARAAVIYSSIIIILLFGRFTEQQFIYFQF